MASDKLQCEVADGVLLTSKAKRLKMNVVMDYGAVRPWSHLRRELLECIANNLRLIELVRFRSVCKDWKFASSNATAEIGSRKLWFLAIYNYKPLCTLGNSLDRVHKISIPELCEATCIGSNYGWLLLLESSILFFFCPFSRAKINLPQFSCPDSPNLVAAFSSPPTCKDCIVAIISKCTEDETNYFKIHTLQRGASSWAMHRIVRQPSALVDTVNGAAYCDSKKSFYFFDGVKGVVVFSVRDKESKSYRITKEDRLPCDVCTGNRIIETRSAFKNVSVSICGTFYVNGSGKNIVLCNHEKINAGADRMVKLVWIHPRFFDLSPQQRIW